MKKNNIGTITTILLAICLSANFVLLTSCSPKEGQKKEYQEELRKNARKKLSVWEKSLSREISSKPIAVGSKTFAPKDKSFFKGSTASCSLEFGGELTVVSKEGGLLLVEYEPMSTEGTGCSKHSRIYLEESEFLEMGKQYAADRDLELEQVELIEEMLAQKKFGKAAKVEEFKGVEVVNTKPITSRSPRTYLFGDSCDIKVGGMIQERGEVQGEVIYEYSPVIFSGNSCPKGTIFFAKGGTDTGSW